MHIGVDGRHGASIRAVVIEVAAEQTLDDGGDVAARPLPVVLDKGYALGDAAVDERL